jgi:hypothetical protein
LSGSDHEPVQEPRGQKPAEKPVDRQGAEHTPALIPILLFLLVLVLTAGLVLWQRETIAQLNGTAQTSFYLLISLVPAILLFGLFRTVAKATGKIYGLNIELGGPTALFIIVLIILLRLPSSNTGQHLAKTDTIAGNRTNTTTTDRSQTTTIATAIIAGPTAVANTAAWVHIGNYDDHARAWTAATLDFQKSTPPDALLCTEATVTLDAGALDIHTRPGSKGGEISGTLKSGDTVTILDIVPGTDGRAQWARIRKQPVPEPPPGESIDFDDIPAATTPAHSVSAVAYLHDRQIRVLEVTPAGSALVIANTLALYGGQAVRAENVLTQVGTKQLPASFMLTFPKPLARISITRTALFATTGSGVTHPAWTATARDARGHVLGTIGEPLLAEHCDVPAQTYTLSARDTPIVAVQFDSDLRRHGKPFAGFQAVLIERLTISPWPSR